METTFRQPQANEMRLLEKLLDHEFPGRDSEPESRCTAKLRSSSGPSRSSRLRVPHASKAKLEGHVDTRGRQYPNSCGGLALR
jgi:hypothetical protein